MRADAARNRQRIFDEACRALDESDSVPTLNELARRCGVGVGTVYRVFPSQRAMREAVFEKSVRALVETATEAETRPDPADALIDFLGAALTSTLDRPGLLDVLITGDDETESLHQAKTDLAAAVSRLLARLDPAPALTGENLLKLLCGLIHAVAEHPTERRPAATANYLALLRTGLTPPPNTA
ncbi:TetR/AcrR family transcriptional regulator [Streptomyces sedi]|uniref:TetR/AcrR family transcriptional regulator n=1 Tax=Streptomyces sedi TaxID=555059 RepID=A0A5C4VAT3_9ACTN|nr:TetR/AcrR family transcriptional regulator [Streptomyces sedi]TNM32977.1 TetR/AcrR family transcriptional regulator [Streptomyces sedi]